MIQERLNDKEHDLQGVQKQSSELLSIAWQKGYHAGFNDGYATRREAEIRPQDEQIAWEQGYECGKNEKRPQGEWIYNQYDGNPNIGNWHCSNCNNICAEMRLAKDDFNFCPNCGAKMRKGGAE